MTSSTQWILRAPVNVTWEITSRCNLACRHCLSGDLRHSIAHLGTPDLRFDECLVLLDEMARMGVFQVNLGGGEPFLREDLIEILRYAHEKGIVTCISTNGLLLNSSLVRELARMELLYIQVSLDGATAETNDAIRGPGVFVRALRGMELLAAAGVRDWSINTVVTRRNFGELEALSQLAARLGAKTRLSRFRPAGNAKQVWEDYRLEPSQLVELSGYLGARKEVLTGDSFFALTGEERRRLGLSMCGAARMTCSVSPTGDVYPCAFLSDPEFLAGNVTTERLGDIFLRSPVMEAFRSLKVEVCAGCRRFDLCHGGCPAVAYFASESIDQPDPECLIAALGSWTGSGIQQGS
jgi:mycofactocin biosynthetic radical S-adenosylmethionine protein MftC